MLKPVIFEKLRIRDEKKRFRELKLRRQKRKLLVMKDGHFTKY